MNFENMAQISSPILCGGHDHSVLQLDYSNIWDSSYYLATACLGGKAMLRNGSTGECLVSYKGHTDSIGGVAISQNATMLATANEDCTAKVWNALSGNLMHTFKHQSKVNCVAFGNQAQLLLTGSQDGLLAYALEQPLAKPLVFSNQRRGVRNVLIYNDDRSLISSSYDRHIRVWDRLTGQASVAVKLPHHAKTLELSADQQILTISYANNLIFIDLRMFTVLKTHSYSEKINCASLHPNKSVFVYAGGDNFITKCSFDSGLAQTDFRGHDAAIRSIKYSPDGEAYASAADDGSVYIWQHDYAPWRNASSSSDFSISEQEDDNEGEEEQQDDDGDDNDDYEQDLEMMDAHDFASFYANDGDSEEDYDSVS